MARDDRTPRRGAAHKIASVLLRMGQLASAIIVLGILSRFSYLISLRLANADGRVVYAMVVAVISIVYSFFLCCPFDLLFMSFPIDFILFAMWLVAFCLLETKTGSHACSSSWYRNYWGYYWGEYWRQGPPGIDVHRAGCGYWRSSLAFAFIACFCHLLSGILGVYVFRKYIKIKEATERLKRQARRLSGKHQTEGSNFGQVRDAEAGVDDTAQETIGGPRY